MKVVTQNQAFEVINRCGNGTLIDWQQIDGEKLQANVISLPPEEIGRRMTAFIKNGMNFIFGGLKFATAPFDPIKFLGKGWSIVQKDQDKVSVALTEVDLGSANFTSSLKEGETPIKGEEKLARLKASGAIRYGATVFMGLWQDYQARKTESVLEKLYQQNGTTFIAFLGDVILSPDGDRSVLYVYRDDDGEWHWDYDWLGNDWDGGNLAACSQV
ncbi:MAG: hypothetical protein NTW11_03160 [Candidatus Staskawiczbacteria bacterium]|nr:hypothetical protein [Candidatus Staskawiczbacteria bacterium]